MAKDGREAIKIAKEKKPDLIILDLVMPDIDGAEVAARLKEDHKTKDIPIIFLTCLLSKREEREKEGYIGENVFIAKPYSIEGLLAQVERLIDSQCVHR